MVKVPVQSLDSSLYLGLGGAYLKMPGLIYLALPQPWPKVGSVLKLPQHADPIINQDHSPEQTSQSGLVAWTNGGDCHNSLPLPKMIIDVGHKQEPLICPGARISSGLTGFPCGGNRLEAFEGKTPKYLRLGACACLLMLNRMCQVQARGNVGTIIQPSLSFVSKGTERSGSKEGKQKHGWRSPHGKAQNQDVGLIHLFIIEEVCL